MLRKRGNCERELLLLLLLRPEYKSVGQHKGSGDHGQSVRPFSGSFHHRTLTMAPMASEPLTFGCHKID